MNPIARIRKALRGNVPLSAVVRELVRMAGVRAYRRRERSEMDSIEAAPARLTREFADMSLERLLEHFRHGANPRLWSSDLEEVAREQRAEFPAEAAQLLAAADRIVDGNAWEVGGFGEITFDGPNYWRCDPLTGSDWGLEYHADVPLYTPGGPDIRVLWEVSRFGHVVALGRAFVLSRDERYAEAIFRHIEEWTAQNPYARGANWASPMDTIMRAVNVVAAFELVKDSAACTPERLAAVLKLADSHCRFTVDNIEFSHVARGNHYITNVAGLFFVATMLPELESAAEWREFGLGQLLHETERQVLSDGVDWESSTGYHKFVTETLLLCLILAERNELDVAEHHKVRCRRMLEYLRVVIRPDGGMPLIGDCDGSQFLPIARRDANDAKYLLDIAAVLCGDAEFKIGDECSTEVLWLFGSEGVEQFRRMPVSKVGSAQFPNAGTYILRHEDLYATLNANDVGLNGRGSHSHNDALSIEVSALGRAWIVDAGSYVYNLDREARHRFRSTAAHSTLMMDGLEQNKIEVEQPFVSSNDARPQLNEWSLAGDVDRVSAEHYGYRPLVHRRTVELNKPGRYWSMLDEVTGEGEHEFVFSFHLNTSVTSGDIEGGVMISSSDGAFLAIVADTSMTTIREAGAIARHYGGREPAEIVRFSLTGIAPLAIRWLIVPVAPGHDIDARLSNLRSLLHNNA